MPVSGPPALAASHRSPRAGPRGGKPCVGRRVRATMDDLARTDVERLGDAPLARLRALAAHVDRDGHHQGGGWRRPGLPERHRRRKLVEFIMAPDPGQGVAVAERDEPEDEDRWRGDDTPGGAIPSNCLVEKEASRQDGFATTPFWSGGCDHRHQQGGRRLRELAHS